MADNRATADSGDGSGSTPSAPSSSSTPVVASAAAPATTTTGREADNAASNGTSTSQTAANDAIPPLWLAIAPTNPATATDDSMLARAKRPVRDRYQAIRIGRMNQLKKIAS